MELIKNGYTKGSNSNTNIITVDKNQKAKTEQPLKMRTRKKTDKWIMIASQF